MKRTRAFVQALATKIRAWLPVLRLRAWLSLVLPLIVMLAFVIGVGPETQRSIFSALNSSAPSPYEALYGDAISPFPGLMTWLSSAFWWPFLIIAPLTILASLKAANFRLVLFSVALWTAALLTLLDIGWMLATSTVELPTFITNVTANISGSIVVALIVAVALIIHRTIRVGLREHRLASLIVAGSAVIATGILTSTLVHYGLRFVYEPLPARVSAVISPPSGGYFVGHQWPDRPSLNLEGYPEENFDFIGPVNATSTVSVEAIGPLSASWTRQDPIRTYDLEIRFLADCVFQDADRVPAGPPSITRRNVNVVNVATNDGKGRIAVAAGQTPSIRLLATSLASYTMERDEDDDTQSVVLFTRAQDQLRIEDDTHLYLLGANLFRSSESTTTATPRTIAVQIGNETLTYRFRPTLLGADNSRVICHTLNSVTPGVVEIGPAMTVAVLVKLTPATQHGSVRSYTRENLNLRVGQGWTTVTGLQREGQRRDSQFLSFVSAVGGLSDVQLNGENVDVAPYESLAGLGNFRAQTLGDGRVHVEGVARAAWRGVTRVNTTRWEDASEWRLWLLGVLAATAMALGTWFWPRMVQAAEENVRTWCD